MFEEGSVDLSPGPLFLPVQVPDYGLRFYEAQAGYSAQGLAGKIVAPAV